MPNDLTLVIPEDGVCSICGGGVRHLRGPLVHLYPSDASEEVAFSACCPCLLDEIRRALQRTAGKKKAVGVPHVEAAQAALNASPQPALFDSAPTNGASDKG